MLDVISVKDALLAIDTDRPLDLPGLCTGCGVPTDELLKVEVGAGDATTEVKDLALHAVHLVPLRSIHIPCCKRCRSRVRKAKMFALASVASGFAMFALIPFVADHVSVMVASCLAFAGIMLILFAPILLYMRARNTAAPLHVLALAGGRLRYVFYSKVYSGLLRDKLTPAERIGAANRNQPIRSETNRTSVTAGSGR
jgi:hypothetical protein